MIGLTDSKNVVKRAAEHVDAGEMLKAAARSALERNGGVTGAAAAAAPGRRSVGVAKPGLIAAGGVAGLTAVSAAVSAVRRSRPGA